MLFVIMLLLSIYPSEWTEFLPCWSWAHQAYKVISASSWIFKQQDQENMTFQVHKTERHATILIKPQLWTSMFLTISGARTSKAQNCITCAYGRSSCTPSFIPGAASADASQCCRGFWKAHIWSLHHQCRCSTELHWARSHAQSTIPKTLPRLLCYAKSTDDEWLDHQI